MVIFRRNIFLQKHVDFFIWPKLGGKLEEDSMRQDPEIQNMKIGTSLIEDVLRIFDYLNGFEG